MLLELLEEEAEAVREVLDITLHELSYEIASADRPEFRQMLRHRRELLGHALEPWADRFRDPNEAAADGCTMTPVAGVRRERP